MNKEEFKFIFSVILCILFLFAFTFLHEIGHVITAILTKNEVISININILDGYCIIKFHNWHMAWAVYIMGSLLVLLIAIPLFIYLAIKKSSWRFLVGFIIFKETLYWALSPFLGCGDGYHLLRWGIIHELEIITLTIHIIAIICFIISIFLFFEFLYTIFNYLIKEG